MTSELRSATVFHFPATILISSFILAFSPKRKISPIKFMRHIIRFFLAIFIGVVYSGCDSSSTLPAASLHPFGRVIINDVGHIELISSAAHVGFTFQGDECQVMAHINDLEGHNYLQYELDGVYEKRITIQGKDNQPIIIHAKDNGQHTVWLYKATEAHTGPIFIEKIIGKQLHAIQRSDAPLIEFIGNSITCGAAADPSEVPCGAGVYHDQHNAYSAYGPRVARALKTNFILSSVSGIGIYRNWNSDGPTMPEVYDNADFQEGSSRQWDFEKYKPAIVSIALGTNDFSNGDGVRPRLPFDSAVFVSRYIKFVEHVKSKYPDAQIALLSSPIVNGDARRKLQSCLTAVKQHVDSLFPGVKPVAIFFFKPMQAQGCSGHPNVADHAVLADELAPFFTQLLN
jgi:lysophospholipase L1-like esterase